MTSWLMHNFNLPIFDTHTETHTHTHLATLEIFQVERYQKFVRSVKLFAK